MSISPETKSVVDEIRRNQSLTKALQAERDLWKSKAMDAQSKLDEVADKDEMSDEDREAIRAAVAELDSLNDELEGAAQENTKPEGNGSPAPSGGHDYDPEIQSAPLMPTSAFDPDPTGNRGVGDAGQPNQPRAIETPGGFVTAGGGATHRAPGSFPDSPSSSVVVPTDPDAKAPVNNADLVKSGLGDSSQNALIDGDGRTGEQIAAGQATMAPKTDEDAMDAPANQRPVIKPNVPETDVERTAKSDAENPEGSRVSDADKDAGTDAVPPARGGPNG